MPETVTPMQGDVWRTIHGDIAFISEMLGGLRLITGDGRTSALSRGESLSEGAALLFRDGKPVPASQPDAGETITRECVAYQRRDGGILVDDLRGSSLNEWLDRHGVRLLGTVAVHIPRSLLSVRVLDAATSSVTTARRRIANGRTVLRDAT